MATFALGAGNLFGVNTAELQLSAAQTGTFTVYTVPDGFYARVFSFQSARISGTSAVPWQIYSNRRSHVDNSYYPDDASAMGNNIFLRANSTNDLIDFAEELSYFASGTGAGKYHLSCGDIAGVFGDSANPQGSRMTLDSLDRIRVLRSGAPFGDAVIRLRVQYLLYKKP